MASICVGTLAMMDAGVKINAPVAGISIGLYSDENKAKLVTDIIGAEDHCGDMDFKVAGTRKGITGFQVDLKIPGLKWDLVEGAFEQAKQARGKILDFMDSVISTPREELSTHAPRIEQISIDPDKIGELIGPGGKNIRRITEMSGAQIDIDEDGTVRVYAANGEAMEIATLEIKKISMEPEIDELYEGRVTGIKDFGAFVEILPGKDGLVHISEMADCRINSVEDICKVGDTMWVKCIGIDDRGRIKLSRREAMRDMDEAGDE
jgi:polyribonucleotide nucleotidyltransferase